MNHIVRQVASNLLVPLLKCEPLFTDFTITFLPAPRYHRAKPRRGHMLRAHALGRRALPRATQLRIGVAGGSPVDNREIQVKGEAIALSNVTEDNGWKTVRSRTEPGTQTYTRHVAVEPRIRADNWEHQATNPVSQKHAASRRRKIVVVPPSGSLSIAKGVIRGIPLDDDPKTIDEKSANSRNPTALAAKRLSKLTTFIIAFEGLKLPTLVHYRKTLLRCARYWKQIGICHQCGRFGHRMDVYLTTKTRYAEAALCGGAHPMTNKTRKARFKTPYIVKRSRWERRMEAQEQAAMEAPLPIPTPIQLPGPLQIQAAVQAHIRTPGKRRENCRSRQVSATEKVNWTDAVKG
ncbi:hypothetical protein HPB49_005436 [Dermacentor silvarum]|uniref:Uncharacterized protein n=1 Tax=Dermacentor silvarum TaxID=543639 RepID=A0ACB8D382_DERSI|nr:hypothetical protein HPB49_005436 [Dermacentor silvarum]